MTVRDGNFEHLAFKQSKCDEKPQSSYELSRYPSRSREQFPVSGMTFELINDETMKKSLCKALQAQQKLSKIKWNEPYNPSIALKLAEIYSNHFLHADAIAVLESIDAKHGTATQEPRAYLLLSNRYYDTGLDRLSLDALKRAFIAATKRAMLNVLKRSSDEKKVNFWQDKELREAIDLIQKQCVKISESLKKAGESLQPPGCQQVYQANYNREFHQGFPTIVMPAQKPGCSNLLGSSSGRGGSN